MKNVLLLVSFFLLLFTSCINKKEDKIESSIDDVIKTKETKNEILTKADSIIDKVIIAHGGELYDEANYSFTFRNKKYQFINNGKNYSYYSEVKRNDSIIKDVLINEKFERYINDTLQKLSHKDIKKYYEALNSVIYFATLPYKLKDASVNKKYIEEISIKGKSYDVIGVTFDQEGGGHDYQDEFYYFVNKQKNKIDYLAYNYHVNEGGVRFREAYNSRVIDGIIFQDYINYEAPLGISLKELPDLFQDGKLKELSRIVTENIINNNK